MRAQLVVGFVVAQQFHPAQDWRERCAQFVRNDGQKFVFDAVGFFGFAAQLRFGAQGFEAFVFGAFGVVNIGAGAKPFQNFAVFIAQRLGAAQKPAVNAVVSAKTVFDFVGLPGFERVLPTFLAALDVVGMQRVGPAVAVGFFADSGVIEPLLVVKFVESVGARHPHDLRNHVAHETVARFRFACGGLLALRRFVEQGVFHGECGLRTQSGGDFFVRERKDAGLRMPKVNRAQFLAVARRDFGAQTRLVTLPFKGVQLEIALPAAKPLRELRLRAIFSGFVEAKCVRLAQVFGRRQKQAQVCAREFARSFGHGGGDFVRF